VPFPGSVKPAEVIANVQAAAQQTHLLGVLDIPELATGNVRARRILEVKSDMPPPGYLVVELDDLGGKPLAKVAMTKGGVIISADDSRNSVERSSLDLSDATTKVQQKRGRAPISAEYVYFHNVAERGISICRPLVAVTTERGVLYFNSKGEAFAEDGSLLITELGARSPVLAPSAAIKHLRLIGQW
jgi:hypothetical protein